MSGVSNPVPSGSHIPHSDNVNLTLQISGTVGNFSVAFAVPPDTGLTIPIYHNSLVSLTLDTSNCDWEFDTSAAVTLGTPGYPGNRYMNLQLGSGPRCTSATFEAAYLNIQQPNFDPYNMKFRVYSDPTTGAKYPGAQSLPIDPMIKNPG